ncbi:hypothetical protein HY971_03055 [Candidatus Kaiserbacteria bacterium]|nr:hypothetical protein [Candidatus Kaiserbacteria bacterium]
MKFTDIFKRNNDQDDVAAQIKAATNISMDKDSRERMRAHLFEYTQLRPMHAGRVSRTSASHYYGFLANLTAHIRPIPVLTAVLIVAVSGGTVAAAETSLPGDTLYPVKVHITEEIRASIATTPKARADWAVARAERRLEEAAMLALAGRLDDATRTALDANFDEHMQRADENRTQLENDSDSSDASEIEKNIGAVRVARRNILDGTRRGARVVVAALQAKAAADTTATSSTTEALVQLTQESPQVSDEPETVARGHRTAAKVRIEATKKFLERSRDLKIEAREKAQERLKEATESFSSGDDDVAHGKKEEASSHFDSALESATEIEDLISDSNDSDEDKSGRKF